MPHPNIADTTEVRRCIDLCLKCHETCNALVQHCLGRGGEHAAPEHIALLLDCAQICETAADFMGRSSAYHTDVCRVCAEICEVCAQDCRRFEDDPKMRECAQVCEECSKSCSEMSG